MISITKCLLAKIQNQVQKVESIITLPSTICMDDDRLFPSTDSSADGL